MYWGEGREAELVILGRRAPMLIVSCDTFITVVQSLLCNIVYIPAERVMAYEACEGRVEADSILGIRRRRHASEDPAVKLHKAPNATVS